MLTKYACRVQIHKICSEPYYMLYQLLSVVRTLICLRWGKK